MRLRYQERVPHCHPMRTNAAPITANCPASTVQNPTTNFNHIPGALYFDVGGSAKLNSAVELYGRVDNVANHRVPPFGSTTIYDTIGRVFRLGVRFTH